MMSDELKNLAAELEKFADDLQKVFGRLSPEQINWKLSAESWSIGQCLDHLIKTHREFHETLDAIADGRRRNSLWENRSPFSSFFGKFLKNSLSKDTRKVKTPSPKIVPPSYIENGIIERFKAEQKILIQKIELIGGENWRKIIVTSPLLRVVTYSLADAFQIIVEHERRHYRQAQRVMQSKGFPQ